MEGISRTFMVIHVQKNNCCLNADNCRQKKMNAIFDHLLTSDLLNSEKNCNFAIE